MSSHQHVYVMHRLSKAWPGGKEVLKNISLSFLPGAKIGVLGLNGAGKSTLLKIMAGLDTEFNGEAWAADGIKVGYLAQEPELDASMDVAGNVLSGLGEAKELMDRFNEVSARFAEELTDEEMNEVIAEQAELQEKIDAIDGWDLERKAEIAMDALRVPAGDADVTKLSGGEKRRVALCTLLLLTRHCCLRWRAADADPMAPSSSLCDPTASFSPHPAAYVGSSPSTQTAHSPPPPWTLCLQYSMPRAPAPPRRAASAAAPPPAGSRP